MASNQDKLRDLVAPIADKFIAAIEAGQVDDDWERPWKLLTESHSNPLSGARYSGINPLILSFVQTERGYVDPRWVTFNQCRDAGGRLEGAKGMGVRLPKWNVSRSCQTHGEGKYKSVKGECCANMRTYGFLSSFTVFNIAHVVGIDFEPIEADERTEIELIADVEAFVAATGAEIQHLGQDRAFYTPSADRITMPERDQFTDARGYYSTLLHELVHWSGHKSRTDRENRNAFGSEKYAFEELVAELGSATLMRHFGVEPEPHIEHAKYVKSWLGALRDAPEHLFTAASQAAKAVDWLESHVTVTV